MNLSLTADDVVAVATIGGAILTPIVAYIRFVHSQQSATWRAIDRLKEDLTKCVTREEQEKYRLELKSDLSTMEGRIIKEMERLVAKGPHGP